MERRIIYCWFGGKEKPEQVKKCIESWHKYMPDYDYLEINENNFDVNINRYTQKAYAEKKWAFVSDVARLWGLYAYGGIYMDTDVEVFKPLDIFLTEPAFTGFENIGYPVTAVMGAEKNNPIIKEMLEYYADKEFDWQGYGKTPTNTMIMSDILAKNGIDRNRNELQCVGNFTVYTKNIFCPNWWEEGITDESYTRHLMLGSWG